MTHPHNSPLKCHKVWHYVSGTKVGTKVRTSTSFYVISEGNSEKFLVYRGPGVGKSLEYQLNINWISINLQLIINQSSFWQLIDHTPDSPTIMRGIHPLCSKSSCYTTNQSKATLATHWFKKTYIRWSLMNLSSYIKTPNPWHLKWHYFKWKIYSLYSLYQCAHNHNMQKTTNVAFNRTTNFVHKIISLL